VVVRFHEELRPPNGVHRGQRVARLTQDLADEFSRGIAAHPHDWHMLQPLFLADLPEDDPRRRASSGAGE
jgi:KDO2-lipid IV(A) lauroyltransferase